MQCYQLKNEKLAFYYETKQGRLRRNDDGPAFFNLIWFPGGAGQNEREESHG